MNLQHHFPQILMSPNTITKNCTCIYLSPVQRADRRHNSRGCYNFRMPKNNSRIELVCPCCQATLLVDAKTGLILQSQEKKTDYSFEKGLKAVQERNEKSEELFAEAFHQEQQRQQGLEAKFRQALDSKDELEEPPRLWDLD